MIRKQLCIIVLVLLHRKMGTIQAQKHPNLQQEWEMLVNDIIWRDTESLQVLHKYIHSFVCYCCFCIIVVSKLPKIAIDMVDSSLQLFEIVL